MPQIVIAVEAKILSCLKALDAGHIRWIRRGVGLFTEGGGQRISE